MHSVRRSTRAAGASACRTTAAGLLLLGAGLIAGCAAEPTTVAELGPEDRAVLEQMMAEEDSRPAPAAATALQAGLQAETPLLRRFAARGLGRLESPEALPLLEPALADESPEVRAQAAMAIAQSVFNEPSARAATLLQDRLGAEQDPAVRGALARALGRLRPVDATAAAGTLTTLIDVTRGAPPETLLPTLRGLEWLVRTNGREITLGDGAVARLVELTRYGRRGAEGFIEPAEGEQDDPDAALSAARIRRLAVATLRSGRALDAATAETALYDPDAEVRRIAAAGAGAVSAAESMPILVQIALADADPQVRYEGLRVYAQRLRTQSGCGPIVAALEDDNDHVALLAIDLLAQGCRGMATPIVTDPQPEALLTPLVQAVPETADDTTWQRGAHALVSLARLDATPARPLISELAAHPTWQVRMYAARAAALAGDVETLRLLAGDEHANVINEALRGLADTAPDEASAAAVTALANADYQLLITAADVLEGTTNDAALPVLAAALARVTAQQRETSRDARLALLERFGELGDADQADSVRRYLDDFDPRVAELAADVLEQWTGTRPEPAPEPLPRQPMPSIDELLALDGATARIEMRGGGAIEMVLHAFEAPTNVARFARQARDGYFEGLTFHRVVPNFVVQGGSPGANEYVGDGPFTRDELGVRSHLRGTVGISTRGRDTGDGQIFINLVDNVRLDYNYTIIGTVVSGMDVVDAALEGATIERVTLVGRQ